MPTRAACRGSDDVIEAFSGFFLVGTIIAVGYLSTRAGVVSPGQGVVLSRMSYYVLAPCLLFAVLREADIRQLFSGVLWVSGLAAAACFAGFAVVAATALRRRGAELVIGSVAAGLANAGTLGIPVSVYFLGSAAYVAPIILAQAVLFMPLTLAVLDLIVSPGDRSIWRSATTLVQNPVLVATALGVFFSLMDIEVPAFIMDPVRLLGDASVPLVLLAFGMSFVGTGVLRDVGDRVDVFLVCAFKLLLMPTIAWALGAFAFGLQGMELYAVTLLAALPTAGNVFTFAQRYGRGEMIARDAGLLTTIGSLPALLVVTLLFAP